MGTSILELKRARFNQNVKNIFFYSGFFPLLCGFIAFATWVSGLTLIGLGIFVAIACYVFVSQEDMTPIIPLLFNVIMMFRSLSTASNLAMFIVLAPAAISVLIHVFKYRYKPNLGKLFFPIVMVTVALFTGGITSPYIGDYLRGLASMISLGPALIIVYLFFLNYLHPPKHFCLKTYFCKCVVFMTLFAGIMSTIVLYNQEVLHNTVYTKNELGWANINVVGTMILLSIPLCFYLMIKTGHVLRWFSLVAIFTAFAFIIQSSLVLLFLITSLPVITCYSYFKIDQSNRVKYLNFAFGFLVLAVAVVCVILVTDYTVLTNFFKIASVTNGREMLYNEALSLIKENPLFGVGLGYYNDEFWFMNNDFKLSNLRVYNFHSTFLHVFATMGIIGMVAYVYYFIQRTRTLTQKNSRYSKFAFTSFLLFSMHGMMDTCEFNMIPLVIILTLIFVVAEIDAKTPLYRDHLFTPKYPYSICKF